MIRLEAAARPAPYVPLWVKSNYSFLEGASHPEELVETAHALGLPAMALTDRDGVYGIVKAHVHARPLGLKLLLGAQLNVSGYPLVVLATCRESYGRLCRLLTLGHGRGAKGECRLQMHDLCDGGDGLLVLATATAHLVPLKAAFGDRLYAAFPRHLHAEQRNTERRHLDAALGLGIKPVACQEVLYHAKQRGRLQDILTCMRHRTSLAHAATRLRRNHEHDLKSAACMQQRFADMPAWLHTTLEVAERCRFSLADIAYRYPGEDFEDGRSAMQGLRDLVIAGARERYGVQLPPKVTAQIARELDLIHELQRRLLRHHASNRPVLPPQQHYLPGARQRSQ